MLVFPLFIAAWVLYLVLPFNLHPNLVILPCAVAFGAAFHDSLPACEATTVTVPAPVNDNVVPPEIVAGPPATAKDTPNPLEAVADSVRTFVAICAPSAVKAMVWFDLASVVALNPMRQQASAQDKPQEKKVEAKAAIVAIPLKLAVKRSCR